MRRRTRTAILCIVTGLTGMGLLVAGCVALDRLLDPFVDRPFALAAWAGADHSERGEMARDALCHLVVGSSKDRVQELLGPPDDPFLAAMRDGDGYVDIFGNQLL